MTGKNGKVWTTEPPQQARRGPQDILRTKPGVTNEGIVESIVESFGLFITSEIKSIVMRCTNREAQRVYDLWNQSNPQKKRKVWKCIDDVELDACFGLLILAGAYRSAGKSLEEMWDPKSGRPIFHATMSLKRFKSILRFLRFDNKATRAERAAEDRLAPIRDIWEMLVAQFKKPYIPSADLTVDEQLALFRGRCSFIVYMPDKPGKYGIKVWWTCDSATSFPLNADVYLGRQPGEAREVGQGFRVVTQLVSPWFRSGRNVTADNFFNINKYSTHRTFA